MVETATERKSRGGYYTPPVVAEWLARWAVHTPGDHVLEPSAGDGSIAAAIEKRLGDGGRLVAVEIEPDEARKLRSRLNGHSSTVCADFFDWYVEHPLLPQFDAVVGNPPFVRYQSFPERSRATSFALMREAGLRPTRLMNLWVPFVVAATKLLRPGGRLAMILPAELLQVGYAAGLRDFLTREFRLLRIVTFRGLLFDGIQQETVLLLGERGEEPCSIRLDEVTSLDTLDSVPADSAYREPPRSEKWTRLLLSPKEERAVHALEQSPAFHTLGAIGDVDVGVVTGRNEFFLLTDDDARSRGIEDSCLPVVGRSHQIPGLALGRPDMRRLRSDGQAVLLFAPQALSRSELTAAERAYVEYGEHSGFHEGYKCRVRLPAWWRTPAAWVPDAFLLRQIHSAPRFVANHAGASCTDTLHRVRIREGLTASQLAVAAINSLTFATAELRGRSYGGGVLELEPSEAENLLIPREVLSIPSRVIHRLLLDGDLDGALDLVDHALVIDGGVSERNLRVARGAWKSLRDRRSARRSR